MEKEEIISYKVLNKRRTENVFRASNASSKIDMNHRPGFHTNRTSNSHSKQLNDKSKASISFYCVHCSTVSTNNANHRCQVCGKTNVQSLDGNKLMTLSARNRREEMDRNQLPSSSGTIFNKYRDSSSSVDAPRKTSPSSKSIICVNDDNEKASRKASQSPNRSFNGAISADKFYRSKVRTSLLDRAENAIKQNLSRNEDHLNVSTRKYVFCDLQVLRIYIGNFCHDGSSARFRSDSVVFMFGGELWTIKYSDIKEIVVHNKDYIYIYILLDSEENDNHYNVIRKQIINRIEKLTSNSHQFDPESNDSTKKYIIMKCFSQDISERNHLMFLSDKICDGDAMLTQLDVVELTKQIERKCAPIYTLSSDSKDETVKINDLPVYKTLPNPNISIFKDTAKKSVEQMIEEIQTDDESEKEEEKVVKEVKAVSKPKTISTYLSTLTNSVRKIFYE